MTTSFLLGGNAKGINDGGKYITGNLISKRQLIRVLQLFGADYPSVRHSPIGTGKQASPASAAARKKNEAWYTKKIRKKFSRPEDLETLYEDYYPNNDNDYDRKNEYYQGIDLAAQFAGLSISNRYYYVDVNVIDFNERFAALDTMEDLLTYYFYHVHDHVDETQKGRLMKILPKKLFKEWYQTKTRPDNLTRKEMKGIVYAVAGHIIKTGPFTDFR
jgi:hypothetical protein